jgi:tetratricopeptide (TPR) repeat protein
MRPRYYIRKLSSWTNKSILQQTHDILFKAYPIKTIVTNNNNKALFALINQNPIEAISYWDNFAALDVTNNNNQSTAAAAATYASSQRDIATKFAHHTYISLGMYKDLLPSLSRNVTSHDLKQSIVFFPEYAMARQLNGLTCEEWVGRAIETTDMFDLSSIRATHWAILALIEYYEKQGQYREIIRALRELESIWMATPTPPPTTNDENSSQIHWQPVHSISMITRRCIALCELGEGDLAIKYGKDLIHSSNFTYQDFLFHQVRIDLVCFLWRVWISPQNQTDNYKKNIITLAEIVLKEFGNLKTEDHFILIKHKMWDCIGKSLLYVITSSNSMAEKKTEIITQMYQDIEEMNKFVSNNTSRNNPIPTQIDNLLPVIIRTSENNNISSCMTLTNNICLSLIDLIKGNPIKALQVLLHHRNEFSLLGGLDSQRDILEQTILYMLNQNSQSSHNDELLLCLLRERIGSSRPNSPLTWWLYSQVLERGGNSTTHHHHANNIAQIARNRARDMGWTQGGSGSN